MKFKAGLFFILLTFFAFVGCAHIQSSKNYVSQDAIEKLTGEWDYFGYAALPGCLKSIEGKMTIQKSRSIRFDEIQAVKCVGQDETFLPFQNPGTGKILLLQDNGVGRIQFDGGQDVLFQLVYDSHCLEFIRLWGGISGTMGEFKVLAVHHSPFQHLKSVPPPLAPVPASLPSLHG